MALNIGNLENAIERLDEGLRISNVPLSDDAHGGLIEGFSESSLPWKVDVVDWATTSPSFRGNYPVA